MGNFSAIVDRVGAVNTEPPSGDPLGRSCGSQRTQAGLGALASPALHEGGTPARPKIPHNNRNSRVTRIRKDLVTMPQLSGRRSRAEGAPGPCGRVGGRTSKARVVLGPSRGARGRCASPRLTAKGGVFRELPEVDARGVGGGGGGMRTLGVFRLGVGLRAHLARDG